MRGLFARDRHLHADGPLGAGGGSVQGDVNSVREMTTDAVPQVATRGLMSTVKVHYYN